jgi:hypothetical protein
VYYIMIISMRLPLSVWQVQAQRIQSNESMAFTSMTILNGH